MDTLMHDLRFAFRSLRKTPAFTAIATLALAAGIGANTTVFSFVNGVLLRPLPYDQPEQLVRLWSGNTGRGIPQFSIAPVDYFDWKQARSFAGIAAYEREQYLALTGVAEPELIGAARASSDLFTVFGVRPVIGRALSESDVLESNAAVISYELWQRRFGGERDVVGRTIMLGGEPRTIVGVAPEQFRPPGIAADVFLPFRLRPDPELTRGYRFLRAVGRLAPGVTLAQAQAELDAIALRLGTEFPASNAGWGVTMRTLRAAILGETVERALIVLSVAVGFLLLIACTNVANLLLARAADRQRELGIRVALGAGQTRIVRQLLTESMVLALLGGVTGLFIGAWGVDLLRSLEPGNVPRLQEVGIDARVLAVTGVAALLTTLLFGLLPAVLTARASTAPLHGIEGRGSTPRTRHSVRSLLVIAQVALSLMLLVGAGLMVRSFQRVLRLDPGFNADNVLTLRVALPQAKYSEPEALNRFHEAAFERIATLPGVLAAGGISSAPFGGPNSGNVFQREGVNLPREFAPDADYRVITRSYLDAMGIPLRRGRTFSQADGADAPLAILISESMANRYWPNEDPIGTRVRIGNVTDGPLWTIIGIVADARYFELEGDAVRPMMYWHSAQNPPRQLTYAVRTTGDPAALTESLRQAIWSIDPEQPIGVVATMDEVLDSVRAPRRFQTLLLGVFALLALLLATAGIYGVVSFYVAQRTREIAVRMALGGRTREVLGMVLRRGMLLVIVGIVLGSAGAFAATRQLQSLLYDVSPTDTATFVAIALLLTLAGLLACHVPARRAARVDPMLTLRGD
jgi:putative ABC transport system permease protein